MKTYDEMAREADELKKSGKELDGLIPLPARVKQNADTIYSVRFSREEITRLREAAALSDMKLSELIRKAALSYADIMKGQRDVKLDQAKELLATVQGQFRPGVTDEEIISLVLSLAERSVPLAMALGRAKRSGARREDA